MYQIIDQINVEKYISKPELENIFQILVKEAKATIEKPCTIGFVFLREQELIDGEKTNLAIKYATENFDIYMDIRILQMVIYDELPDFILDDINDLKREVEIFRNTDKIKDFFNWFTEWLKPIFKDITVFISVPNELQPIYENGKSINGVLILDLFEKINQKLDAKVYLKEILDKADELQLSIYAKPKPRYKHIKSEEHKNKITKEYLTKYYNNFGFVDAENGYLLRKPK